MENKVLKIKINKINDKYSYFRIIDFNKDILKLGTEVKTDIHLYKKFYFKITKKSSYFRMEIINNEIYHVFNLYFHEADKLKPFIIENEYMERFNYLIKTINDKHHY